MRVIAGTARGTRLKAPKNYSVRPTADRVKEALFSIIGPRVASALFIDFYAGSGAVGIESLSRGARLCIFVDNSKDNILLIKENLLITKLEQNSRLIMADVDNAIVNLAAEQIRADLIYLDPPYDCNNILTAIKSIFTNKIITDNGLLVVEHSRYNRQWTDYFTGIRQKKYGNTFLTFISPVNLSC